MFRLQLRIAPDESMILQTSSAQTAVLFALAAGGAVWQVTAMTFSLVVSLVAGGLFLAGLYQERWEFAKHGSRIIVDSGLLPLRRTLMLEARDISSLVLDCLGSGGQNHTRELTSDEEFGVDEHAVRYHWRLGLELAESGAEKARRAVLTIEVEKGRNPMGLREKALLISAHTGIVVRTP